jgi:hypothetical protein
MPAVVGPDLYRQRLCDSKEEEPCTSSDQAFALVQL